MTGVCLRLKYFPFFILLDWLAVHLHSAETSDPAIVPFC